MRDVASDSEAFAQKVIDDIKAYIDSLKASVTKRDTAGNVVNDTEAFTQKVIDDIKAYIASLKASVSKRDTSEVINIHSGTVATLVNGLEALLADLEAKL
jgi:hypothetical protein